MNVKKNDKNTNKSHNLTLTHFNVCTHIEEYNYCRRHLFWFPFFGFFSMKICTDPLNLNISQ